MAEIVFTDIEKQDIDLVASLPYKWEKLKNSTILISGGSGFIGSYLIAVIEARNRIYGDNIKVISLSRSKHNNRRDVKFISFDIVNPIEISEDIDYIVHLASNTHPQQYVDDPIGTITTNVFGCHNLLELSRRKGVKRFLLASSVEIYGNGIDKKIKESDCGYIDCNTVRAGYNEAKRLSESLCQSYRTFYNLDCVIARLSRVFGPDWKKDTKALAQFMNKAVNGEDIILKSLGEQRFSYCYVIDAVSGLLKILLEGIDGEAYNLASDDDDLTLSDYAHFIAKLAKTKVIYDNENIQLGASTSQWAIISNEKLKRLNWKPNFTNIAALEKTFNIYKLRKMAEHK